MADGLGNMVGGLIGLAILSNVVSGNNRKPQTRTVIRTVYRNRPLKSKKNTVKVVKRTARPSSFFGPI